MLSADYPGAGGPGGAGGQACGALRPPPGRGPPGTHPREPLAERVRLSGGERETPVRFRCQRPGSVWGRGCRALMGPTDEKRRQMSPVASPACSRGVAGPSRLSRDRSRFSRGGSCAKIPIRAMASALRAALRRAPSREKSANHFSPPNARGGMGWGSGRGEGLKPHGTTASTGKAENGAEPGPPQPARRATAPASPSKAVLGHLDPPKTRQPR